jgi:riboflavin kinase/FMN adenylyltransferase
LEIVRGLDSLKKSYTNTVLTIGNYDGMHIGHQKILTMVTKRAMEIRGTSMLMTFDPHPMKVLSPERNIKLLITPREKERLIKSMGIDVLLYVNFTKEFSRVLPEDFIENILVEKIKVKEIIVGTNYAFGRNKKGTVDLLRRRGEKYGFSVRAVRNAEVHGQVVSSSSIRSLLQRGAVSEVSKFLGRVYSIEGTVIKGKGRGQKILHVPTANITTPVEIAPREGVYAVKVRLEDTVYDGVANIGKNPTFGNSHVSYEVHLLDFSGDILGKNIKIYFIDRLRGERTFPNVTSLENQIKDDIKLTREILGAKRGGL